MATTKKTASAANATGTKTKASAKAAPAKPAAKKTPPAAAKTPTAKAPAKTTKPAAKKPAAKAAPAPAKPAAKKPAAKATPAPAKPAAKKPATKATPAPAKPAAKKPATKAPPASAKPAAKKPATKATPAPAKPAPQKAVVMSTSEKKPAPRRENRESLTPAERERVKKLRATLELLKADPEWPAFLEEQKEALHAMRDHLLPNMQNTTRDHLRSGDSNVSSSSGQHIGDAGSEAEVRDLTINLLNKDREQLFEIDAALERIRRGTYGICEISLELIPKGRLRVRPFCRLTVKCQEEYEKKYGSYANYRAKNSDHVGYSGLQNDMKNAISLDDSEE